MQTNKKILIKKEEIGSHRSENAAGRQNAAADPRPSGHGRNPCHHL